MNGNFLKGYIALLLALLPSLVAAKTVLPDSIWTIRQKGEHHHVEANEIWLSADRPGAGTGSEVLNKGYIQWETGFEVAHMSDFHLLTLPTTLFRFGLHKRAELRLEYTGTLPVSDHPESSPQTKDEGLYEPEPLNIGTKILLCGHHGGSLNRKWIPRTALMLNIGIPLSPTLAKALPISGTIDLLCENEILEWLSIGYDIGAHWVDWAPTPDIFASLGINFTPTDHLDLFIESYNIFDTDAIDPATNRLQTHYDINLDFGLTYAVHPRVQLDIYAAINLYNSAEFISTPRNNASVGFGVTWLIWHPQKNVHE